MKKEMKGLIALGAAAVVLGGGLIALKVTDKSDDTSSESVTDEETTPGADLVLIEDGDKAPGTHTLEEDHYHGLIKNVKVKNEFGELEVVMTNDAEYTADAEYTLKGYEDIKLKDSVVRTLVNTADGLTSASIIEENCTDFEKFGLGSTAVTVDVEYGSGTERRLYIGTIAPVANQTYVRAEGSDTVFTIFNSSANYYKKPLEDYIELTMLSEPPAENYPIVDSVRIERKDIDYDIYLVYGDNNDVDNAGGSSATHVMKEPVETFLKVEASSEITNGMFGLTAESVKSVHCTEKDIEDAGLSDPFCTVTMKCDDGNEYVLLMSKPYTVDGVKKSDVMFKDANIIFTVTTEEARWATVMPDDLASQLLFSSFVWNVSELTATSGDMTESFTISMRDSSIKTNEAKTNDALVMRNGEEFDSERYRQFYSFLINLHAEELPPADAEPQGEPIAAVVVKDALLGTTTKYEFYEYSVMKCLAVVDGKSQAICSKANTEALIENIRKISTGEEFTEIK